MTALASGRLTPQMGSGVTVVPSKLSLPVKAATLIYAGSLVALNAGYLVPASSAVGLVACGRAVDTYDNSTGSNGAINAEVELGCFRFENSAGGDAIAQANVGQTCYAVDDQTVALTSNAGARSAAGRILAIDSVGVWVLVGVESIGALNSAGITQAIFNKAAADGAAGTATTEHVFHRVARSGTIASAFYVPDATLTGDASNNATLAVAKRDGAGGGSVAIASKQTTAVNGNWSAFVPVSLGTITGAAVIAGDILTFAISKTGTGVVVPAGQLVVVINPA